MRTDVVQNTGTTGARKRVIDKVEAIAAGWRAEGACGGAVKDHTRKQKRAKKVTQSISSKESKSAGRKAARWAKAKQESLAEAKTDSVAEIKSDSLADAIDKLCLGNDKADTHMRVGT